MLFGGAYAPNDAIYRKRYAFVDALIKFEGDHITDHNKNFLSLKYKLDRRETIAAVFRID